MGTIISLFMSGYLCEYVGWESLFYVYGEWCLYPDTCVSTLMENHCSISMVNYVYI